MAIIIIANLPMSCIDDDCGDFTPTEPKITKLDVSVGTFDSLGFVPSLPSITNDFNEAAINISIAEIEYYEITKSVHQNFSLINSAFACSWPPPNPQAIKKIKITSESEVYFDGKEYSISEDLIDLFKVVGNQYLDGEVTVERFIELQNNSLGVFGELGDNVVFQLQHKPDSAFRQKFFFTFEFTDTEKVEVETSNFAVN